MEEYVRCKGAFGAPRDGPLLSGLCQANMSPKADSRPAHSLPDADDSSAGGTDGVSSWAWFQWDVEPSEWDIFFLSTVLKLLLYPS